MPYKPPLLHRWCRPIVLARVGRFEAKVDAKLDSMKDDMRHMTQKIDAIFALLKPAAEVDPDVER